MTTAQASKGRIRSLDQFRGFTVLAMFVVNFAHGMEAVPPVFQHNENWFSLADWIMPGFLSRCRNVIPTDVAKARRPDGSSSCGAQLRQAVVHLDFDFRDSVWIRS